MKKLILALAIVSLVGTQGCLRPKDQRSPQSNLSSDEVQFSTSGSRIEPIVNMPPQKLSPAQAEVDNEIAN